MKKIVLFIASIFAVLQSIATRNSNDANRNPLVLSSSDGIYNHGSHASHASHVSHYSQTSSSVYQSPISQALPQSNYSVSIEMDSIGDLSIMQIKYIKEKIAKDWKSKIESIIIKKACYVYVSLIKKADIKSNVLKIKHFPAKTKCVYIEIDDGNWYIIPLSDKCNAITRGTSSSFIEISKSKWMYKLK